MNIEKEAYYVDLVSGSVLGQKLNEQNLTFKIYATDNELAELKAYLDKHHTADIQAYFRSHIPFLLYHNDPQNDRYDDAIKHIYEIIYKLGDDETRHFISENRIIEKEESKYVGDPEIQRFK